MRSNCLLFLFFIVVYQVGSLLLIWPITKQVWEQHFHLSLVFPVALSFSAEGLAMFGWWKALEAWIRLRILSSMVRRSTRMSSTLPEPVSENSRSRTDSFMITKSWNRAANSWKFKSYERGIASCLNFLVVEWRARNPDYSNLILSVEPYS